MSWAYVKKVVTSGVITDTNNQQVIALTGTSIAQGNVAILDAFRGLNNDTIASVADSQGNTWTVDHSAGTSHNGLYAFGAASGYMTTALGTSDTITVTWTGGAAFNYFWGAVTEYTGLASASRFDKGASATAFAAAGANAITSGATAATTATNELIHGLLVIDDDTETLTGGTGFTLRWQEALAGNTLLIGVEDKNGATTIAYTATGGWSSGNQNELGLVATYKEASSSVTVPQLMPAVGMELTHSAMIGRRMI
jgi:hypothetical protein